MDFRRTNFSITSKYEEFPIKAPILKESKNKIN